MARYHAWMQNKELRELTASEPLSLEEEYEMQESWLNDDDKCTFIVLDRVKYEERKQDEAASMVGDVNVFLNEVNEPVGELEVMIAEDSARGRGVGKEATLSMMRYSVDKLHLNRFTVKIGYANDKSINMFTKFGFQEVSRSDVFQEVTMELNMTEETLVWLRHLTESVDIRDNPTSS